MEYTSKKKALLALFMLSCLLLPRGSSAAPLSRSMSLMNHQPSAPAMEDAPLQGAVGDQNLGGGEVAARMDIEVNDYPGSGANNRHEPRSPGRA
ncbi:hypothetical protein U9M48_017364 [Paspalum notatum var. saurae]|uniref:Uncharacterized protein n=1 Tax=Paspalum notatum var. saurae TaxID=547442 RepID=A0AAQ3WNS5_PASNO